MLSLSQRNFFNPSARSRKTTTGVEEKDVEAHVMAQLGTPPGFFGTRVRRITPNSFRVNVYAKDGRQTRVVDSFFVTHDDGIFSTNPQIANKYSGG